MTASTDEQLSRTATRGGFWGLGAELSSRLSQGACFFFLASVLSPGQFGSAAIAFVAAQVATALTYAGLGTAVQVLGPDLRRDRTAVGLALVSGAFAALVLTASAAPICDLMNAPDATNLVRLVALVVPLLQLCEVLANLLDRELRFRTTSGATIIGSVLSAVVGLSLAATGAGAIALIAQGVVQQAGRLLVLIAARPGNLRPALHRAEARQIWGTGRELLVSTVFGTASSNVDNVTVSAIAGPAALGGYGFVFNLTGLPYFLVGLAVSRVSLPIYGALRAQAKPLRGAFMTALEVTAWLGALPLGFLAVAGPEALVTIFGHKWDPVGNALRLLALASWLRTVETTSATVLIASGEASTVRRVQQWQLAVVLVLLVPLVYADGATGAGLAVLVALVIGTAYSLLRALRHTTAQVRPAVLRLLEGLLGGAAAGTAGFVALRAGHGALSLPLSLLAAVLSWALVFALVRPQTVRQARSGLHPPVSTTAGSEGPLAAVQALQDRTQTPPVCARAVVSVEWDHATVAVHPRYQAAQALVRRGNQPLAWVALPLIDGRADMATVHAAVLAEHPGADLEMPWPAPRTAQVSVIVCSTGRTDLLTRSLRSILASDHLAFEVVVVDDNPLSGAARSVVAAFADARLRLVEGPGEGQTEARSRGVVASSGPLVAFTDEDCVVDPGWLGWLTAPLVSGESAVATGLVLPGLLETAEQLAAEEARGPRELVRQAHHVLDGSGSLLDARSLAFTREALDAITDHDVHIVYEPRALSWQYT